ncbi:hypothetical protein [Streptomyces sp. NPDC087300]|uniref:hypothetical protein n=1 Tax=Streptomyces sp. NPDC087300 TaxID=3365780 RepID=UPI0038285C97
MSGPEDEEEVHPQLDAMLKRARLVDHDPQPTTRWASYSSCQCMCAAAHPTTGICQGSAAVLVHITTTGSQLAAIEGPDELTLYACQPCADDQAAHNPRVLSTVLRPGAGQ